MIHKLANVTVSVFNQEAKRQHVLPPLPPLPLCSHNSWSSALQPWKKLRILVHLYFLLLQMGMTLSALYLASVATERVTATPTATAGPGPTPLFIVEITIVL